MINYNLQGKDRKYIVPIEDLRVYVYIKACWNKFGDEEHIGKATQVLMLSKLNSLKQLAEIHSMNDETEFLNLINALRLDDVIKHQ